MRRLGLALLMIFLTVTFTFFMIRLMPGNPATLELHVLLKQGVPLNAALKYVQALYGISVNQPIFEQYLGYIWHMLHGNFGKSILYPQRTVLSLIGGALPWTVFSVGLSLLVSSFIGVVLGTVAGYRRNGWLDRILTPVSSVLSGIPNYLTGMVFLFVFAVVLNWLPQSGAYSVSVKPGLNLPYLGSILLYAVLPVLSYVISQFGGWYLLMKSSTVSTLGEDFIVGARARGMSSSKVVLGYVMPNSILPLFTNVVLSIGFMFGGSVFVESIFSYPGLGYLLSNSVSGRDYPLMEGLFFMITSAVILSNLLADLMYMKLDPRITAEDLG